MHVLTWYIHFIMRNISELDGLSRERRLARALAPITLSVLEERFPVLLKRALSQSDFSSIYKFQSLVVLLEIELFDTDAAEKAFMQYTTLEKFVPVVYELTSQMDDWCRRLEYACLSGKPITLLKDLSGQITTNISPMFCTFYKQYGNYPGEPPRQIWLAAGKRNREENRSDDFSRRFYLLLLASVRLLQSKCELYREEIYSSGKMDPSLAIIVAFLHNYGEIAGDFNRRWRTLPMFYLDEILKAVRKKQFDGITWLTFESTSVGMGTVLHQDTYLKVDKDKLASGYKLLSDVRLTQMSLAGITVVVVEKNKERYPEAALEYVTAVKQRVVPDRTYSSVPIGLCLHSAMLLLGEGKREVNVLFSLTDDSLAFMDNTIEQVARIQEISRDEALFKVLHDAFHLWVSTAEGWQTVENFYIRFEEGVGLRLVFRLDEEFPPVSPLEGELEPSFRLLVNSTAWLFPYSWARKMFIKSVRMNVSVQGLRHFQVYNDLGSIDIHQAFAPFGTGGEKGAWFAFGCYEMACKSVKTIDFTFNWQHLPTCNGGLEEYYRTYNKDIDNRSFRGRVDQLRSRGWKPLPDSEPFYLFRTSSELVPQKDESLTEHVNMHFSVSENSVLPLGMADKFHLSNVRSGFYRLVLTEPDMGFGMHEYNRLFAETMMYNSRARHKKPLPEVPLSLSMDTPQLGYVAEEECFFNVGNTSEIRLSHIRPLSNQHNSYSDNSHPVAMLDGPEDEGNLLIGIKGAIGENLIRMYLDMELLQREIDHDFLPHTDWCYRDASRWVQMDAVNVLRDDTGGLMHSGAVVLQLPFCITSEMTDSEEIFWLCVAVHSHLDNCSTVRSIYLNVAEAKPEMTEGAKLSVPGLVGYRRIAPLVGTRSEEDMAEVRTRISERISHRNRLLLPDEYEQMVLQEFPDIVKIKCFPGMDAKRQNRSSLVTLAAIHTRSADAYPLCTDELLCRMEEHLRQYTSPFVKVDVINPVYEEVTVFCGISLKGGEAAGTAIQEVHEGLRDCIAPWNKLGETPVFGYSFSMRDLQSRIKESKGVSTIHGIKLLQVVIGDEGKYDLREYISTDGEELVIAPSVPWAILVPASRHYVKLVSEGEWRKEIEIGDFEIDNTFVIK